MQHPTLSFAQRVDEAIKNTPHVASRDLKCVVHERQVTLRGVVRSYFQKQMAQEAVQAVDGVESIENQLDVSYG